MVSTDGITSRTLGMPACCWIISSLSPNSTSKRPAPLQNTPTSTTLTPNNFTLLNKLHLRTHTTILNSLRSSNAHARIIVTDVINSHTSSSLDITGGTYLDRRPCRQTLHLCHYYYSWVRRRTSCPQRNGDAKQLDGCDVRLGLCRWSVNLTDASPCCTNVSDKS